jgi:hypothetical protein
MQDKVAFIRNIDPSGVLALGYLHKGKTENLLWCLKANSLCKFRMLCLNCPPKYRMMIDTAGYGIVVLTLARNTCETSVPGLTLPLSWMLFT